MNRHTHGMHHMYRRAAVFAAIGMSLSILAACGNATSHTSSEAAPSILATETEQSNQVTPEEEQVTDDSNEASSDMYWSGLNGTWVQDSANDGTEHFEAHISGTPATIAINWTGGDEEALYWKGSFELPEDAGNWEWTSYADTAQNSLGTRACQDETKQFVYDHAARQLYFDAEIDGQPMQITMVRTSE